MYDFCMSNMLSKSEILLLHALYMINNKKDWDAWFEADNYQIQRLTGGLSRQSITEARNKLKQRGRIEFREGKRNQQSPFYRVIPFFGILDIQVDKKGDIQGDKEGDIQPDVLGDTIKNKPNKTKLNKKDIVHFWESVWSLYPNKKGKGQVSDSQKAKLFKVGTEQLSRCIERYKKQKPDWQAFQNGSTFFNGGYVDYLDENFSDENQAPSMTGGEGGDGWSF